MKIFFMILSLILAFKGPISYMIGTSYHIERACSYGIISMVFFTLPIMAIYGFIWINQKPEEKNQKNSERGE